MSVMDERPVTVLVIDSDAASRKYLADMLGKNGYSASSAPSAREGLIMAWQNLPQVIIADPSFPDMQADDLVSRLRQDRRTAQVPCIAISEQLGTDAVNQLLHSGFTDFLPKSGHMLAALLELIPRLLNPEKTLRTTGTLLVFLSAKGGTGTSSLCANVAMCIGKTTSTLRVAVIDMVLPIGSIASIVGYTEPMNIVTISMQKPEETTSLFFQENLPRLQSWFFRLLAGSPDPGSANQLVVGRLEEIISCMLETYDYVIVDLGRSLSRISLPIIHKADVLALVLSPDTGTVNLSKTVLDFLVTQNVDTRRIYPIMNRSIGLEGMTKNEMEGVLGLPVRALMPYMGGNFALANNRHEAVVTKFPTDSASFTLLQMANEMTDLARLIRGR